MAEAEAGKRAMDEPIHRAGGDMSKAPSQGPANPRCRMSAALKLTYLGRFHVTALRPK
jgi:hypothetical protein